LFSGFALFCFRLPSTRLTKYSVLSMRCADRRLSAPRRAYTCGSSLIQFSGTSHYAGYSCCCWLQQPKQVRCELLLPRDCHGSASVSGRYVHSIQAVVGR